MSKNDFPFVPLPLLLALFGMSTCFDGIERSWSLGAWLGLCAMIFVFGRLLVLRIMRHTQSDARAFHRAENRSSIGWCEVWMRCRHG